VSLSRLVDLNIFRSNPAIFYVGQFNLTTLEYDIIPRI